VTSGDCLLIMGSTKAEIPPEKSITLSYLMAPRLVRLNLHLMISMLVL
jgi:staphylococcal nuclease domain-containing protein 1